MRAWNAYWVALIAGIAVPASGAILPRAEFDRYQVIIDRKPFGAEPAPAPAASDPTNAAAAAADTAFKSIKITGFVLNRKGEVTVGVQDELNKKDYLFKVGQSEDGLELVDADYARERAHLRRDGAERWISMSGEISAVSGAAVALAAVATPPAAGSASRVSRRTTPTSRRTEGKVYRVPSTSPMQRRRMAENPNQPVLQGEEMDNYLREYNLELIRAGGELGPALPIELTPEEDAQLIEEGVLPPPE